MMRVNIPVKIPQNGISEFCQRHPVRRLAFFGSVLCDDFTPQSEMSVPVEFDGAPVPGLAFITIQEGLSAS
jgi:uncharacterized protein